MKEVRKAFPRPFADVPLHISMAGITYPDPLYRIYRPKSSVSVIEYIVEGEGYVEVDGVVRHIAKDMIYFLPAGMDHTYYADPDTPFTKIFMNIDGGSLCSHLTSAFGLKGKYVFDGQGLKNTFEKILITIHSDIPDGDMQPIFHGILTEILSSLQKSERMAIHTPEALKMKDYLDSNLSRIVSSKELSSAIFRSTDYCLKLFRREFGATPYAYQLDRKIETAKTLLTDTQMSIGEISESLGYSDMHYFSNIFKEKCGIRPLAYRKNSR